MVNCIKAIVEGFINRITNKEITATQIEDLVKEKASALWQVATKEVQAGKLDDRPLYWARNKMQAWLKRHPEYKSNYDSKKSKVSKGSCLEEVITTFEEKSRNYTGIDFSKATADPVKIAKAKMIQANLLLREVTKLYLNNTNNKEIESEYELAKKAHKEATEALEKSKKVFKVLITGFDPFQLNPKFEGGDTDAIKTFNPSGIVALSFYDKTIGNVFVQICIFPTRYEDFDAGVIEEVAKQHLPK